VSPRNTAHCSLRSLAPQVLLSEGQRGWPPSYPHRFWWSKSPSEEVGSCGRGEPIQAAPQQADGVRATTVGRDFTGAQGASPREHGAPHRQHDAQQPALSAVGTQDTTELPFRPPFR
jgi:hypothetical protein